MTRLQRTSRLCYTPLRSHTQREAVRRTCFLLAIQNPSQVWEVQIFLLSSFPFHCPLIRLYRLAASSPLSCIPPMLSRVATGTLQPSVPSLSLYPVLRTAVRIVVPSFHVCRDALPKLRELVIGTILVSELVERFHAARGLAYSSAPNRT
jgi:hypothetical protein